MILKRSILTAAAFLAFGASDSFATSVSFPSTSLTLSLGNIDLRSYDGSGFDTIGKTFPLAPTNFLQISSFNGAAPSGTDFQTFFLSSVAQYKNQDEFGLMNSSNQFVSSVKGSQALGTEADYHQGVNESLHFGFQSPEGVFSTTAADNPDGQAHMLVVQATADSVLTIPNADLQGNSVTFNLLAGDFIFFIEDMLQGSNLNGALGYDSDFNDFLTVVRTKKHEEEVPEPATVLLLGAGSLIATRRRRRA